MEKMRMESVDMTAKNVEKIVALFPNCVTEALDEEHSTAEHKVYKNNNPSKPYFSAGRCEDSLRTGTFQSYQWR